MIHTSKGWTLTKHLVGKYNTRVWPVNIAADTSSVKWLLNASINIKDWWKPISFVLSHTYISHIFSCHTIIKRTSIQTISWVTIQRLSGTVRSLIVRSVLPGEMINIGNISPYAAMVRTTVTCFSSQAGVLTVTDRAFLCKGFVGYHIEENWRFIHVNDKC